MEMADSGRRLPSPAVSDSAGAISHTNIMAQSITAEDSHTTSVMRLREEKDRLVNEKHEFLQQKDALVTRLVKEMDEMVSSKDSMSTRYYAMLQEKDAEILKLKEEHIDQKARISGLAEALQLYINQEAEEEDIGAGLQHIDDDQEM